MIYKKIVYRTILGIAILFLIGCGDDSGSITPESLRTSNSCLEEYGISRESGWSASLSDDSYFRQIVCDRAKDFLGKFIKDLQCIDVRYNENQNRYDITLQEGEDFKKVYTVSRGCSFKLGTEADYSSMISGMQFWSLSSCLCVEDDGVTYYRVVDKARGGNEDVSSSSMHKESSSSRKAKDSSSAEGVSSGDETFDVLRDDDFVQIGSLLWMRTNLNKEVEGSFCYDDREENCEKYGRLYTWSMAMNLDSKYDHEKAPAVDLPYQGICPEGTYLPSDAEWEQLHDAIENHPEIMALFMNQLGGAYDYSGKFRSLGSEATFWSSTEYDVSGTNYRYEYAWAWYIHDDSVFNNDNSHKFAGYFVRCVKDAVATN